MYTSWTPEPSMVGRFARLAVISSPRLSEWRTWMRKAAINGYGSKFGTPTIGWLILNYTNICGPLGLPFWPTSKWWNLVDFPLLWVENGVFWVWDERFLAGKIIKMVDFSANHVWWHKRVEIQRALVNQHTRKTPNPQWPYLWIWGFP